MCKVSVIMTSYNKPNYVGRSIESVLNQSFEDFELIIMDDNSNVETLCRIVSYLGDERVKLFRSNVKTIEERASVNRYAAQINKALEIAKGEYISYITDDNVYMENRLETMVNYLDDHPKSNICYSASQVLKFSEKGMLVSHYIRRAKKVEWKAPCAVDHCSVMHRASILSIVKKRWGSYWDVDPAFYVIGDARFFYRLNYFWPFYPIDQVLDVNYVTEISFHTQLESKEKSDFVKLLPKQRSCKELRDALTKLKGV